MVVVISAKSGPAAARRPAEVGLYERIPIFLLLAFRVRAAFVEELDVVTLCESHDGLLPIRALLHLAA